MRGYYAEMVQMYGFDVKYFRRENDFYDPNGILQDDWLGDFTYGEDSFIEFNVPVDMKGLMDVGSDSYLFSMIGVESQGDGKIFFTKEQFELDLLETSGIITSGDYNESFNITIDNLDAININITGSFEDFTIEFDDTINLNIISGAIDQTFEMIPTEISRDSVIINESIAGQKTYLKDWIMQSIFSGSINEPNISIGDTISLNVNGNITYNRTKTLSESMGWKIAPAIGDFFRITFPDTTYEDYEITNVTDRDINQDGISPLMEKYVWKCTYTRRTADSALLPSGHYEEPIYEDLNNTYEIIEEKIKDEIFDEASDDNVDFDIYGGM
jgi:hypothetical protein